MSFAIAPAAEPRFKTTCRTRAVAFAFASAVAFAAAVGIAACPASAVAQSTAQSDDAAWIARSRLVFGASRYAQEDREAPASVTIIPSDEIEQQGYRTLAEVLNVAAGLFTYYDGTYTYLNVRGISRRGDLNTHVLILVDGHRLNDATTDGAGIGSESLVDVDAIDHVEVVNGPGSVLFGTNAVFGVVNVVTKRGRQQTGLRASVEGGSFDFARGVASWGYRGTNRTELLVSSAVERRGGRDIYFPEYDDGVHGGVHDGVARGVDGENVARLLFKGTIGDVTLFAAANERHRQVPTASYGTMFSDARYRIADGERTVALSYEHSFADLSRAFVSTAVDAFHYRGAYPYDTAMLFRDFTTSRAWTAEGQYLRFLGNGHKLTLGGETRWIHPSRIGAYDVATGTTYVDLRNSSLILAAFAQTEWRLGDHAILYAGVRHDRYDTFGGTTNPRVSLVLRPTATTTVKALYGRAFRAPNAYELNYEDGGVTQKRPASLDPEIVASGEVSVEQELGSQWRASVGAYRIATRDLINLVVDPVDSVLVFVNVGEPRSRGVELKLLGTFRSLRLRGSYAYQRARDDDGTTPVNSPTHLAHGSAAVPFAHERGTLAFELHYVGSRPTRSGALDPAYTVGNLTAQLRPFGPRTTLFARLTNAFDASYNDPGGEEHLQNVLPRDGRGARLGITRSF